MTETPTMRLCIIIPAWNEQEALPQVLAEVRAQLPWADVLVVNDGSTDGTSAVARNAGVMVLDLPVNLGVGGAMRAGYKFADRHRYDVAVQLDADGQHDPAEVAAILAPLQSGDADLVIGARFAGKGDYQVRGARKWAMRVLSATLSRVAKTHLTDTTSGFKAANARTIGLFARDYPAEYLGDTIESVVIASRSGIRITQVPVEMRPRVAGTPSHNPLKSAIFLGRAILALLVALSRPKSEHSPERVEVVPS